LRRISWIPSRSLHRKASGLVAMEGWVSRLRDPHPLGMPSMANIPQASRCKDLLGIHEQGIEPIGERCTFVQSAEVSVSGTTCNRGTHRHSLPIKGERRSTGGLGIGPFLASGGASLGWGSWLGREGGGGGRGGPCRSSQHPSSAGRAPRSPFAKAQHEI